MTSLFQKWKRFTCRKRHEHLLKYLKVILSKYQSGSAKKFGKPLFKDTKADRADFKDYFKAYHFEKNFYTNYHAIHKLFDTYYQLTKIPQKFYVYDIACGPYTATISLLNFLERNNSLKGRAFSFTLCDHGDLALELLYQAAKENSDMFFPIPYFVQIRSEFDVNVWSISLNQCLHKDRYGCKPYLQDNLALHSDADAINLILCSYVGSYGERKFFDCIKKTFAGFSPQQKTYPTYIIYSHYIGKDKIEDEVKKAVEDKIGMINFFNVKSIIKNDKPVPFSNCYYLIFEIEKSKTCEVFKTPQVFHGIL